jgi:hypothetical protein
MATATVALLAVPLPAWSSSVSARCAPLLEGIYSGNTCNAGTPNQKGAKQICDAHGGVYDSVLDMCGMPGDK